MEVSLTMKRTVALILLMLLCFEAVASSAEVENSGSHRHIVITFLGDCTLGNDEDGYKENNSRSFVSYAEKNGPEYFFSGLQSVIAHDDLTVANLECVFWEDGSTRNPTKTYCFRGPDSFVDILTGSSIEAVSFANNHNMDYGIEAAIHTTKILDDNGVAWFGMNMDDSDFSLVDDLCKTYIYEKDGIRIGFVAIYTSTWNKNIVLKNQAHKEQVQALKDSGCDLIIACLHGGREYGKKHDIDSFAQKYLGYGCDIVIGNHPHVLQGIEECKEGTIVYCLGNCCFGGNTRIHAGAETCAVMQFDLEFDSGDSTEYLGHTLTIWPAVPASENDAGYVDYQPKLASGSLADRIMKQIQSDTRPYKLKLNPFVEGIGAVQDFVPNPKLAK